MIHCHDQKFTVPTALKKYISYIPCLLDFDLREGPICDETSLEELSTFFTRNLLGMGYMTKPQPCSSMKMIVVSDMQEIKFCNVKKKQKEICKEAINIRVRFPSDYTEIKQERVSNFSIPFSNKLVLSCVNLRVQLV